MSYMLPHKLFVSDGDEPLKQAITTASHSYFQYNNDLNDRVCIEAFVWSGGWFRCVFVVFKSTDSQNIDDNKAFDDVVFDVLRVDPEDIAVCVR